MTHSDIHSTTNFPIGFPDGANGTQTSATRLTKRQSDQGLGAARSAPIASRFATIRADIQNYGGAMSYTECGHERTFVRSLIFR